MSAFEFFFTFCRLILGRSVVALVEAGGWSLLRAGGLNRYPERPRNP